MRISLLIALSCVLPFICCYSQKYIGDVGHWHYVSIISDTTFDNDTIEVVYISHKKKKDVTLLRSISIYSNHHVIKSRIYWNKDWSDHIYSYDNEGRLICHKAYSSEGEFKSQVNYTYRKDTVIACSANNIGSTNIGEFILDQSGRVIQEKITLYGQCQGVTRFAFTKQDSCEILYTVACDCSGQIIDTSSYRILDKAGLVELVITYTDSGKICATYTSILDAQYRPTIFITSISDSYGDNDPGVSTCYYEYFEKTKEYEKKVEWIEQYSSSKKLNSGCKIWRFGSWPTAVH